MLTNRQIEFSLFVICAFYDSCVPFIQVNYDNLFRKTGFIFQHLSYCSAINMCRFCDAIKWESSENWLIWFFFPSLLWKCVNVSSCYCQRSFFKINAKSSFFRLNDDLAQDEKKNLSSLSHPLHHNLLSKYTRISFSIDMNFGCCCCVTLCICSFR